MRAFVDSNVFVYAAQAHKDLGEGSKKVVGDVEKGRLSGITSSLNISEAVEVIYRYGGKEVALRAAELLLALPLEVVAVGKEHLVMASNYFEKYGINFFDCVFLAVMEERFVDTIITNDRHFEGIKDIQVVNPKEY